jgi:hypothetical protein
MVIAIFLVAPAGLASSGIGAASLSVLHGHYLDAFGTPQREALATLFLELDRHAVVVSELFWGLWLLPLARLVWRSRFLPRWLAAWLFANGVAYVVLSATGILAPGLSQRLLAPATPLLFGELALTLWLLIVGVRPRSMAAG